MPTGALSQDVALPLTLEGEPLAAGRRNLFHEALSQSAGGILPANPKPSGELEAINRFFEVRFLPDFSHQSRGQHTALQAGQRWQVRITFEDSPLGLQYWRRLRQLFTRR